MRAATDFSSAPPAAFSAQVRRHSMRLISNSDCSSIWKMACDRLSVTPLWKNRSPRVMREVPAT